MNYEQKAKEKLKTIEGLLTEQQGEIKAISGDLLKKVQSLPNGDPNKSKFNDLRNRILKAGASKNKAELLKIIEELKDIK